MIQLPDMCQTHQVLLLRQTGIGPDEPWRSTIICVQIALFQGASTRVDIVQSIETIGCLACRYPDLFGAAVVAFQQGGIGAVKARGEEWLGNPLPLPNPGNS